MSEEATLLNKGFVRAFLKGAVLQGYDPYTILAQAGIPRECYDDPSASINGEQLLRLMQALRTLLNDAYLGFVKQPYKPILNRAVVKEALDCKILGESIRARIQFREALRDDVHYEFLVDAKAHEFSLAVGDFDMVAGVDEHLFYWLRLTTIYRYQSWLIGKRIKLNRVDFASPEPAYGRAHLAIFNCDVHFNQPQNRLTFDNRYLSYPIIRTPDEITGGDFETDFPDWLMVPGRDQSMTRQVEQALKSLQKEDVFHPTLDTVAERLRVNGRTLRTQLARENQNFQRIKAEVRKEQAIKHLVSTDLPIATVALELGFIEPGDFSRNFKRWTGYSPSEYRSRFGSHGAINDMSH